MSKAICSKMLVGHASSFGWALLTLEHYLSLADSLASTASGYTCKCQGCLQVRRRRPEVTAIRALASLAAIRNLCAWMPHGSQPVLFNPGALHVNQRRNSWSQRQLQLDSKTLGSGGAGSGCASVFQALAGLPKSENTCPGQRKPRTGPSRRPSACVKLR